MALNIDGFINYVSGKYGSVLSMVRNTDGTAGGIRLEFNDGISADVQSQVQAEIAPFAWDFTPADVDGLESAIFADSTIPASARTAIFPFIETLRNNHPDVARKGFWAMLKAEHTASGDYLSGNCSDGVAITAKLEQYASLHGFPLV